MTAKEKPKNELSELIMKGGDIWVPPRLALYGDEKSGKTGTAAQAPNPLFIGNDDGRRRLQVDGLPQTQNWEAFVSQLTKVSEWANEMGYRTVVTDTINGIVDLAAVHVCETQFGGRWNDTKHGFLAWGGSQGWGAVSEEVKRLFPLYDKLIDQGIWVVLISHAAVQHVRNPLSGDYDRFAPAMDRRVWARFAGWLDVILRVDYDASFIEENGKRRAVSDNTRILRCAASLSESAGCRVGYELPETLPFSWASIEEHLGQRDPDLTQRLRAAWSKMSAEEIIKAERFLGVSFPTLDAAPQHKAKALLNRLQERTE